MSYWFRQRIMKYNPNHDDRGRFASDNSSALGSAAKALFDRASKAEPFVSKSLTDAVPDYAQLDEFSFRLKTLESTARKIGKKMVEDGKSLEDAAADVKDSLRYTVLLPDDKYVEGIKKTLDGMKGEGFSVYSFRNTWGTPIYQGVNVNLKTPEGQIVELQFHTPASLDTKLLNHKEYEVEREVTATEADKEKTNAIMKDRQSKLKVPKGALGYSYDG